MSGKKIGLYTATSIVIANMIGTGVFTSLGFQVAGIQTGFAIIMLWVLGGIAALTGALCYGEIGAMLPRSGGEYHYLSKIYHPAMGFVSGWVSATVGFAAPVALASFAFGEYLNNIVPGINIEHTAAGIVAVISVIHCISLKAGSIFQNISTSVKVSIILVIIIAGFVAGRKGDIGFRPSAQSWEDMSGAAFAVSFFFVSLAYSGWNAAGYIASEMHDVQKNLPRALLRGTIIVMVLYVLLNFIFMYTTPLAQMSTANGPVVDIAGVAAQNIFGQTGGQIMSGIISVLLLSTISAMVLAGPRVTHAMGEDYRVLSLFGRKNSAGLPVMAILFQGAVALVFIYTATFNQVLTYISFTLNIFTFLTVLGLFILRFREPGARRPFSTPLYPLVPLLFLLISGWLMYFGFKMKIEESLWGLGTALSGLLVYFIDKSIHRNQKNGTSA
ncbi:MAG: amino acid permease [Bacteroidota bacterium]